ncbi:spore coat protein [Priestia koreensis]|uniref:Spore coat protein n=2 Tax=Priestia koreensis TaxID=284581 RepID=A0A0M0LIW6_9BACI|nr:spore coat protein [Priestia koreensis]
MEGSFMSMEVCQLYINPRDIRLLKQNVWSDDLVPGQLKWRNKKVEVDAVYRGAHIRKLTKKSYYIAYYKPKRLFGEQEWHLNAEYEDPSLMRNKLSLDFFSSIGVLSPRSEHVDLTLNARKQGVYLRLESVNEDFLLARNLPHGSIFYAVDADANFSLMSELDDDVKKSLDLGYETKVEVEGDMERLQEFIYKTNTLKRDEFENEVENYLDVDQYLRWLTGIVCTQNYDGFVQNYALYCHGESKRFYMIPWDYDATWGRDLTGKEMDPDYVRVEGFNTLTARLLDVERFRKQYAAILTEVLHHQFTVPYMEEKVRSLYTKIKPSVMNDPFLKERLDQFHKEPDFILDFIEKRRQVLLNEVGNLL